MGMKRSKGGENLEKLEHVESDIEVGETWIQHLEVDVVDVLGDQTWNFGGWVSDDIQECYDVRTTGKVLQDLDFALYLLFFHRFEDFYDAFFVVYDINTLEDLEDEMIKICW